MPSIKVEGLKELQKKLKDNVTMDDVKRVVKHNGSELQEKMMRHADFNMGYQTGTTKRSIGEAGGMTFEDDNMTVTVQPQTEYAAYLEYGTRFMHAQPFVRVAYDQQKTKFKSDMQRLVK